ncbi:hypothetical protein LSAT2_011438 [Lamellibrachia satsuma]|nr:hypothetical protein LSAT2_011438 [Lamellibrachia satsuma]
MLLVVLTVSVTLLGTIQAQSVGEDCAKICQLQPWLAWGPCDSTCGGTRSRERHVCCKKDWNGTTCAQRCHVTVSDVIETAACSLNCVFGFFSGGQCRCEDHGYGRCCQFNRHWSTEEFLYNYKAALPGSRRKFQGIIEDLTTEAIAYGQEEPK